MKIIIFSTLYYPDHLGGAEISTQIIAENLASSYGYDITVLAHGLKDSEEVINGVKVIRHYFGISTDIIYSNIKGTSFGVISKFKGKIVDIARSHRLIDYYRTVIKAYDIAMISGNARNMGRRNIWVGAYFEEVPLIQIVRDPVLLFYKNGLPSKPSSLDTIFRLFSTKDLDKVPHIVGPTKAILDNHERYGVRFNSKTVIPNIVIVENPYSYSYSEKDNSIIYVGSISKPKGSITLINAFKKVHEKYPDYKLVLVGKNVNVDIPDLDYIEQKGHLPLQDVYREIAKAKLLVLPSEWEEAFGRTVIEAIYNGTVAICSDAGGTHELLNDDSDFIFESGNSDELVSNIVKILHTNSREYQNILKKQKEYAEKFSLDENIKIWNSYIKQCVEPNSN